MKRLVLVLMGIVMTGVLALSVQAELGDSGPDTDVDGTGMEAQIEQLLEMTPAERRAYLKALDPGERNGLWFLMRRAIAERNGQSPKLRGSGMDPFTLDEPVSFPQNRAVGTITYDDGFATIGFGGGAIVGNRFNTHTGIPVLASGTVETIQAMVVPGPANTTSDAGFVLLGPQTVGGGALAIASSFGVATGVIDTMSFTGLGLNYTGSSFFVLFLDFANVYIPVFGTGTVLGQGHHGVVGYTGGIGPNITGTFDFGNALNSFVRAGGNIVPVELMSFEAE